MKELEPFAQFLATLPNTRNETQRREAFIALAATGFNDTELATALALGAEYRVRFEQSGLLRRGSVDTFFGNLVIEFEFDLSVTSDHAADQLRGYVAGAWAEDGLDRQYLAVATDGSRWIVYTPLVIDADAPLSAENVALEVNEEWVCEGPADAQVLRDRLNRLLFRKYLQAPTAGNFARDFGITSPTFVAVQADLMRKLTELREDPQLRVLQDEWHKSLQISYGFLATDDRLFVRHTYLAVLARLLVWAALERRPITAPELNSVLSGTYFIGRRVSNLVEDDFFKWYEIPSPTDAGRAWMGLANQLLGFELATVQEDILKPLYEDLVDPETRHDLGEFYTPDWLAHVTTAHLLDSWDWNAAEVPAVLDPTCGSGTFLRAAIDLIRNNSTLEASRMVESLLSHVVGIDVHPLAVTVARATYVLAIKDLLPQVSHPVSIPVYLSNSLQMPELHFEASLFGDNIELEIDDRTYGVPADFVHHGGDFDRTVEDVISVARSYGTPRTVLSDVPQSLRSRVGQRFGHYHRSDELLDTLGAMTTQIAQLIRARRDSVHGFLLKNHYRPAMLRSSFDYVVGNPPWLTVNDIRTPKYKDAVIKLAKTAKIAGRAAGEQGHTELATIFLAHVAREFLRPWPAEGVPRVALVMPRSVFTASHHRYLRDGHYTGRFDVVELWDLAQVAPVFNIPACVVFTSSEGPRPSRPKTGRVYRGRLPAKDLSWSEAAAHISFEDTEFTLSFLGKRSAWRSADSTSEGQTAEHAALHEPDHYVSRFRQGAILYPQSLLIVKPSDEPPGRRGLVRVITDPDATAMLKVLKDARVDHVVDARNLFITAAADHILPYELSDHPWRVVLPVLVDPGIASFKTVSADDLRKAGRLETANWLEWAEALWEGARKPGEKQALYARLDHLGHLSAQGRMQQYVALYTAVGNRPVACSIDTHKFAIPMVFRDSSYWASFGDQRECDYVVAFLNSDYAAGAIRDWMTLGLFGPRHIHKRVLDVPWPEYEPADERHVELAALSGAIHERAATLIVEMPSLDAGRQRRWIRDRLPAASLARVEVLVEAISREAQT